MYVDIPKTEIQKEQDRRDNTHKVENRVIMIGIGLIIGGLLSYVIAEAGEAVIYPTYPYTDIRDYGSEEDTYVVQENYYDDGTYTIAPTYPTSTVPDYGRADEWRTIEITD
jgi:hypothetical protein